jgi:hypothetical protein
MPCLQKKKRHDAVSSAYMHILAYTHSFKCPLIYILSYIHTGRQ